MRTLLACILTLAASQAVAQSSPKPPPKTNPNLPPIPLHLLRRPPIQPGLTPIVKITKPARLDWAFPLPADVPAVTPANEPVQTTYQLFTPPRYNAKQGAYPLIVFVPTGNNLDELNHLEDMCRKYQVLFASPYDAGATASGAVRVRKTIEVLEDVRQRFRIDTDRIYLAGFSSGGRVASAVAFAYPEYVGGVLALSGVGPMRNEGWLRDRARERLSVAVAYGESDPARGELARWRVPVMQAAGVRARAWEATKTAHALPSSALLEEMFLWLEGGAMERAKLAMSYPATRISDGGFAGADLSAVALVEEASKRLGDKRTREAGLVQLAGVIQRWPNSAAARKAKALLDKQEGARAIIEEHQRQHLFREARGLDAYLNGTLSAAEALHKQALLKIALQRWQEVEKLGPDSKEGQEATRRIGELRNAVNRP